MHIYRKKRVKTDYFLAIYNAFLLDQEEFIKEKTDTKRKENIFLEEKDYCGYKNVYMVKLNA